MIHACDVKKLEKFCSRTFKESMGSKTCLFIYYLLQTKDINSILSKRMVRSYNYGEGWEEDKKNKTLPFQIHHYFINCLQHSKKCTYIIWSYFQGSQYRTVPASTAGIYRTGKQTGTVNHLVSYQKKYRPYWSISGNTGHTGRYRKKVFFFIIITIF